MCVELEKNVMQSSHKSPHVVLDVLLDGWIHIRSHSNDVFDRSPGGVSWSCDI